MKASLAAVLILVASFQIGCGGAGGTPPTPPQPLAFTSTPPTAALEGQIYSYEIRTTGPASGQISYQLVSGPAGAAITGTTLAWTPVAAQARSKNNFSISATSGGTTVEQGWTVATSGNVRGTEVVTYTTDSGDFQVPEDVTQSPISASIPDGKGGFTIQTGTGTTEGAFSVTNIPEGYYWLKNTSQTSIWTPSSQVDLGSDRLGRQATSLPSYPTQLRLELEDLHPWQSGDRQQLFVSNTGTLLDYEWSEQGLAAGSTSLDEQIVWTNPLTASSAGDSVYVTQLVSTPTLPGFALQVVEKSIGPLTLEQSDGTELELDGSLEEAPMGSSFRANFRGSSFAQLIAGVNPAGVADSTYFYLDVQPGGPGKGWIGTTPDLVRFSGYNNPINSDLDLGEIAYRNPYPSGWVEFLDYIHYVHVDYTAPGASASTRQYGYLELQTTSLPTVDKPADPLIGPANSPKINGVSFFNNQSGIGTNPTLTWAPPTVGSPTGYVLEVVELYTDGIDSLTEPAGTLYTKSTTIELPPGWLKSGGSYFFRLMAINEPGVDYENAPFRQTFPKGVAQSLSGVITP